MTYNVLAFIKADCKRREGSTLCNRVLFMFVLSNLRRLYIYKLPVQKFVPRPRTLAIMATDPNKYLLNHTMIRVKDPQRSIKYYEMLGMKQINKIANPDSQFDLYFMAYDSPKSLSHGKHWSDRQGLLELTHVS